MEPDNSPNLLGGRGDWLRKNDVEIRHIKFGVDERVLDNVKILIIYPKYDLCGSTMIFVDNIRTLKQYRSLRFYFGCVIIRVGVSENVKMKPDYTIEKPGNGLEIRNIIYDLM